MAYIKSPLKPPLSFPTVSGDVCSFVSPYAGLPLKSHKIALTATQSGSGTPSPSNPRSINGYSAIGISQTDGNYTTYADLTIPTTNTNAIDIATIPVVVGKTYTIYCEQDTSLTSSTRNTIYLSTPDGTVIENNTANYHNGIGCHVLTYTCETAGDMAVRYLGHTPSNTLVISNIIISDSVFNNSIIHIGSTVYGGEYDARTGVFTQTWEGLDMGNLSFELISNVETPYYRTQLSKPYKYLSSLSNTMCNKYVAAAVGATGTADGYFISNSNQLRVRDKAITDPSQLAGTIVVYELATPQTIQLSPCPIDTLLGENNIWADTGDTTLQYPKFG